MRKKIVSTKQMIMEAIQNTHTWKEASEYLGICEDVLRIEKIIHGFPRKFKDAEKMVEIKDGMHCLTEIDPKKESSGFGSFENLKEITKKLQESFTDSIGYDNLEFKTGKRCGLVFLTDLHTGNKYTDHQRIIDVVELIKEHNVYVINGGDNCDNFDEKKSNPFEHILTVPEQKEFVKTIIKEISNKLIAVIQGCFLEGTPVVADDYTMKPIDTIRWVLGSDKPYQVKHHWQNNHTKEGIYRISYMGNTVCDIPATSDHPFVAIKRNDIKCPYRYETGRFCKGINKSKFCDKCKKQPKIESQKIFAKDLEVGDFLYISKPKDPKGNKFTMEDMEIFGWYLAEGSAIPEKAMTCFSLGTKEEEIAEKLQLIIENKHSDKISSTHINVRKDKNCVDLMVYGKKFTNWILKYCGRYSHSKKIHIDVINESNEKLSKLVDCFRLGDGHIRDCNGLDITLTTISKNLAWQMWNILLRIGEFASIRIDKTRTGEETVIKGVKTKHNYDCFCINYRPNRKQFRFCETKKGYFVPIKNIKFQEYEGIVKNLWVDSNEHLCRAGGVISYQCHDEWMFNREKFDLSQYLARHSKGKPLGFGGLITLHVGNQTYRIYARHKITGYTKNSTLAALIKHLARIKLEDVDLVLTGHFHCYRVDRFIFNGKPTIAMINPSFKLTDRYGDKNFMEKSPTNVPMIIFGGEEREILIFDNIEQGLKYLD